MGDIKHLADDVINKIAAGEVVQRPSSVVKELVENAIDAEAQSIVITLEKGGTSLISVQDDGKGMDLDDAKMCLQRHATSKLVSAEDLFAISSMGFRGEAIASIASISHFSLSTVKRSSPQTNVGHKITKTADEQLQSFAFNGPVGTNVVVQNLFYNIPAREKFLKSTSVEYNHCLDVIQAFCMVYPNISFRLTHNNKDVFSHTKIEQQENDENSLRKRLKQIYPKTEVEKLFWFKNMNRYAQISGLSSPPGNEKASSKFIYIFINKRLVKDRKLQYAIIRAYHSHLLKGRYPFCVLMINSDPSLLDVNVHPAKTEIRLQYEVDVKRLIADTLRAKLRNAQWADSTVNTNDQSFSLNLDVSPSLPVQPGTTALDLFKSSVKETIRKSPSPVNTAVEPQRTVELRDSPLSFSSKESINNWLGASEQAFEKTQKSLEFENSRAPTQSEAGCFKIEWMALEYIGSYSKCYLMFEAKQYLLVIDQHAFHERILYERFKKNNNLLEMSQKLVIPELLTFSANEVAVLQVEQENLKKQGFEYELMSKTDIELRAVPMILSKRDPVALFTDLANPDDLSYTTDNNANIAHHLLSTIACHSAVRSGEDLGQNELKELLKQAESVDFYHNCPHGRRVFKYWPKKQVEKWFDR